MWGRGVCCLFSFSCVFNCRDFNLRAHFACNLVTLDSDIVPALRTPIDYRAQAHTFSQTSHIVGFLKTAALQE
jgi:hypothetical protein